MESAELLNLHAVTAASKLSHSFAILPLPLLIIVFLLCLTFYLHSPTPPPQETKLVSLPPKGDQFVYLDPRGRKLVLSDKPLPSTPKRSGKREPKRLVWCWKPLDPVRETEEVDAGDMV